MRILNDLDVGRFIGWMAHEMVVLRRPDEAALDMLDVICAPHRGMHAQFAAWDSDARGATAMNSSATPIRIRKRGSAC